MRLIHALVYIFSIFAFLTIGSLMIIVSLHVLTMEDALLKIQEIYESSWQTFRMGAAGILFIFVGLVFSKLLVKETRATEDVLLLGKWGYVSVSSKAIEDVVRKTLRKFDAIKEMRVKTEVHSNRLKIMTNLSVLTVWNISELTQLVQNELSNKVTRLIGDGVELEISVNIDKLIEANWRFNGRR
jgi:hypothetical protein